MRVPALGFLRRYYVYLGVTVFQCLSRCGATTIGGAEVHPARGTMRSTGGAVVI